MLLRRALLALAAVLLLPFSAFAETDPAAFVREVYAVHGASEQNGKPIWFRETRAKYFTRRLVRMLDREDKAKKVGFDFIYNAQDFKIGELSVVVQQQNDKKARVEARFTNMGAPQRLVYDLEMENGGWRIANIRESKKGGWVLTRILVTGG